MALALIATAFLMLPGSAHSAACSVRLGVLDFHLRSLTPSAPLIQRTLTELLVGELSRNKRFQIVERESLGPLLDELNLKEQGATRGGPDIGEAIPADYLLEGSILQRPEGLEIEYSLLEVKSRTRIGVSHANFCEYELSDGALRIAQALEKTLMSQVGCVSQNGVKAKTVAVIPFRDDLVGGKGAMGRTVSDLVSPLLATGGDTQVVERDRLAEILTELHLQSGGEVAPETAVKMGHLLGAQAVILGSVRYSSGRLALEARTVHVATGRIREAVRAEGLPGELLKLTSQLSRQLSQQLGTAAINSPAEDFEDFSSKRQKESAEYNTRALAILGSGSYMDVGNKPGYERAVADLKRAIYVNPWFADLYINLHQCFIRMYRHAEARAALEALIRRYPSIIIETKDLAMAYFWLGNLFREDGDYANAVKYLQLGIDLHTLGYLDNNSLEFIAECQFLQKHYDDALASLSRLTGNSPTHREFPDIAFIHEVMGKSDLALSEYRQVPTPGTTGRLIRWGSQRVSDRILRLKSCQSGCDRRPLAKLAQLEALATRYVLDVHAAQSHFLKDNYDLLGAIGPDWKSKSKAYYEMQNNRQLWEIINGLEALVRDNPTHPVADHALMILAVAYENLGADERKHATATYRRIVDNYPHSKYRRECLMKMTFGASPEERRAIYKNILKDNPADLYALFYLGELEHTSFHNGKDAKELLEKFLSLNPDPKDPVFNYTFLPAAKRILGEIADGGRKQKIVTPEDAYCSWDRSYKEYVSKGGVMSQPAAFDSLKAAKVLEQMGLFEAAFLRYQKIIDVYADRYSHMALEAQQHIDAITASHPGISRQENTAQVAKSLADLQSLCDRRYGTVQISSPRPAASPIQDSH
ncbi:MAG: CsgG/HfaB family protein [Elusimicrobia bacterium]|nr:CsgG/HfaB family protein [Elusimicrobiota bacterium]